MSKRVIEPDFHPDSLRRRYRDKSGGEGGKGSGFDIGHSGTTPTNRGGSGTKERASANQNQNDPEKKELARETQNNPNAKSLASKGVDKALNETAKKGAGTIVGEGANLVAAGKRARDEGAGKGAQAAETAAAGIRAGAAATGVGGAVVKGYDAVKKGLSVVGVNVKDRYVVYLLIFAVFLAVLPVIIFFLVIFFAWDNPRAILSLGWTGLKLAGGFAVSSVIAHGGASKLAYEVDVKPGTQAIAAPIAGAPAPDTYEYKLAQIDWEKAKLQTLPISNQCEIKTKKVRSTIDGSERSVIDTVRLKTNPDKELEGIARSNCINAVYPIFNTMMRSQFVRDGVNKSLNVRYAYAEPTDSENLKKTPTELQKVLRDKTLTRIWNRGTSYDKPQTADWAPGQPIPTGQIASADAVKAMDALVVDFFGAPSPNGKIPTRSVQKYSPGKYSQDVIDCANNYIPKNATPVNTSSDLGDFWQKNLEKMQNDLTCGIEPKDILLYTTVPSEDLATDPNPNVAIKPKRAALNVVCDMYEKILQPTQDAQDRYEERVKNRINSAAVAAWQAVTYADTNRARYLNINELNKDFYKISGMQSGQEYNYTLDGKLSGTPLEPDAVSRIIGYYNQTAASNGSTIQQDDEKYIAGLKAIFQVATKQGYCDASRSFTDPSQQDIDKVNDFWNNYYPKFKAAMAGLDFYARPEKTQSISQIYNNLTYEDIFFRLMRLESNVATAGTEDGPQNFNRMNFGMKAYMNGISLSLGGRFLTQNEAITRDESIQTAEQYDQQTRGLAYRLLDSQNPSSLTSRLRVAVTDKPQRVATNVATVMANIFNPIQNAAGQKGSLTALLTGKSRVAMAASVYDAQNLKLDPAGIPQSIAEINSISNARNIEKLRKTNQLAALSFDRWDQCFKEFIPSRFHLLYPPTDKTDLYNNWCKPLFDSTNTRDKSSLAVQYSAYHFHMLEADALVYLSNPDKEDDSLNASSSVQNQAAATTPAPTSGGTPTGAAGDTSAQQCPAGTTDAGIGEKYGVGRVLQYKIRLCTVGGITVNVSVAANLLNLLNAAKASGINFGGSGYRTFDRQVELRSTNGCKNTFTTPPSACATPTAIPGTSNHESGEAVDFTQGGGTLSRSSSGFAWLKANAGRFNFYNLPSEPWHWSKDGN